MSVTEHGNRELPPASVETHCRCYEKPLVVNTGWVFGEHLPSFGIQAAYFVLLARLVGSAEYGVLAGAAALVNILSQYSGMGAGTLLLWYASPDHPKFPEY